MPDSNNPANTYPLAAFGSELAFSQANVTTQNDEGSYDYATLAIYNPTTQTIIQPTSPNGGYDPQDFVTVGGTLYFEAFDQNAGREAIYSYNGTSVIEQYNSATLAATGPLAAFNGDLYYGSNSSSLVELTPSTTSLSATATDIKSTDTLDPDVTATDLIVANNRLYFLGPAKGGIWSINTGNVATQLEPSPGSQAFIPAVYNGELYYITDIESGGSIVPTLLVTNGTTNATVQANFEASNFVASGGTLFFDNDSGGSNVGTINGTTFGTVSISGGEGEPIISVPFTANAWTACFCAGTRIATPDGEVPVERLAIGETVCAQFAGSAPIKWIGRRHMDCARHPDPRKAWPVRVNAGAFGANMPRRDLFLSPNHAVYVDDVLIPVRHLINGTSIAQVPMDEVIYYHIELPEHDVLLAEGMQAESYLDVGDRSNFANGGATIRLFPDFASHSMDTLKLWEAMGRAPLMVHGPQLEAVRQRVNELAGTITTAA